MIIRQGKTGSRGQATLKTFGDDEAARDEMSRLEAEQKQKGYEPSGDSTDSGTAL
jgi:predicted DNA-binding WGR domain protein